MRKISIGLLIALSLGFAGCTNKNVSEVSTALATQPSSANSEVQYFFPRAGQHPDQELIKVINSSKSTLDVAIYSRATRS